MIRPILLPANRLISEDMGIAPGAFSQAGDDEFALFVCLEHFCLDQFAPLVSIKDPDLESIRLCRLLGDRDGDLALAGDALLYRRCFWHDLVGVGGRDCAFIIAH